MSVQPDNHLPSSPAHQHNRRAWDRMVRVGRRFTRPAGDEDLSGWLAAVDGLDWLGGDVRDRRLLCLAAGGGRQSILYAMAGAVVTVVDISPEMLRLDREVAEQRGLDVRTVEASMDDLSMFSTAEFEAVIHPVSTCYVPYILPVYRQVARVIRPGGVYISQHKQPASLQAEARPSGQGYRLTEPYYRDGPLPPVDASLHREQGTLEYLHRWEELIGGLCRAGFVIEDLSEPQHADQNADTGSFQHRSRYVAPYVRIKARRVGTEHAKQNGTSKVWTP